MNPADRKKNRILTIAIIIFIILVIILPSIINFGSPGEGVAVDTIARVSYQGVIWKTWRVHLTNDHPIEGNPQRYGVENNPELISQLQEFAKTGQKAKIYYMGNLFVFGWQYSDPEVIYKVERA